MATLPYPLFPLTAPLLRSWFVVSGFGVLSSVFGFAVGSGCGFVLCAFVSGLSGVRGVVCFWAFVWLRSWFRALGPLVQRSTIKYIRL